MDDGFMSSGLQEHGSRGVAGMIGKRGHPIRVTDGQHPSPCFQTILLKYPLFYFDGGGNLRGSAIASLGGKGA